MSAQWNMTRAHHLSFIWLISLSLYAIIVGHWYNNETLSSDPWAVIGYPVTDSLGVGAYADCVSTGFDLESDPSQLVGRAFIVHAEDGSRVSCGIIEPKESLELTISAATTEPIPESTPPNGGEGVTGLATVFSDFPVDVSDAVCYQGYAMNLQPEVESFLLGGGSSQCNVTNGCGAHIHAGTGCANSEEQGGHYYDSGAVAEDPWLLESYHSTDVTGAAGFVGCVLTGAGATEYENKPFIVHGEDGSRLSCGILNTTKIITPGDNDDDMGSSARGMSSSVIALAAVSIGAILAF
ncbi:MAG: hypothetical protein SGILL_002150 [Bacillariaceae sp.]